MVSWRSRVEGTVLGAAIGDAMGHPTEFIRSFEAIEARYGPGGVKGFERFWTRDGEKFAPYTDDTQMAEAVLRALISSRKRDLDLDATMRLIGEGFVEWASNPQGGHRAPGNACLSGCRALARGVHWSEAGGASAGGCGSVMRAFPFGLVFADDLERAERWAVEHSKLTHRDPIALAACAGIAVGTCLCLAGRDVDVVISGIVDAAERYSAKTAQMIKLAVDEAHSGIGPRVTLQRLQGWAAHECIAAACYVVTRHPDDFQSAVLEAANTPGDSDSIASLVGAMVGARRGVEAIPESWVTELERSAELRAAADQAAEPMRGRATSRKRGKKSGSITAT